MQNYKMEVAYDGRKYTGYNKQRGSEGKSIQWKLEEILFKLYEVKIEVIGAVNTDDSVHARGQIVNFIVPDNRLSKSEIFNFFEKYLTDDIILLSIDEVDERFHSRYLLKSCTYEYRLWKKDAPFRPLFERQYVNHMNQILDLDKMKIVSEEFLGEHDFLAFTTNKKTRKSIKEIFSLEILETEFEILICIEANGFLLNMERLIVGTLIQIGLGQLPLSCISTAFETKNLNDVGHKASAGALCLSSIKY